MKLIEKMFFAAASGDMGTVYRTFTLLLGEDNLTSLATKQDGRTIVDVLLDKDYLVTAVILACQYVPLINDKLVTAVANSCSPELQKILNEVRAANGTTVAKAV